MRRLLLVRLFERRVRISYRVATTRMSNSVARVGCRLRDNGASTTRSQSGGPGRSQMIFGPVGASKPCICRSPLQPRVKEDS